MPLGWIVFWWVLLFIVIVATIISANIISNRKTRNIVLMCLFTVIILMLIFGIAFFIPWGNSSNVVNPGQTIYFISEQSVTPILNNAPLTITITNSSTGMVAGTVKMLASGSSDTKTNGYTFKTGTTSGNNYYVSVENSTTSPATISISSAVVYKGPVLSLPQ